MEITPAIPSPPAPTPQDASTGYEFVLWYTIPSGAGGHVGEAQKVTANLYVDMVETPAGSGNFVPTVQIAGAPKFYYYPPRVTSRAAWAALMDQQLFSYTINPIVHPLAADAEHSTLDADIKFIFDDLVVPPALPQANKWYYNPDDGYFYYIGKLTPAGTPNALSPMLLKSVTLDAAADNSHADMEYSLLVNSEAIQNYETAMTSPNGWNMLLSDPHTSLITTALAAANAFAIP
jgi:hypothetical protein